MEWWQVSWGLPGMLCGDGEEGWNPCSLGWCCPRRDWVCFRKELSEKRTKMLRAEEYGVLSHGVLW